MALVLFLSMAICINAQEDKYTFTGNGLLVMWQAWKSIQDNPTPRMAPGEEWKAGYYLGFVSGAMLGLQVANIVEYPPGVNYGQACRVVGKYLEDHPESLHQRDFVLVSFALMEAFPKKK
jgi:hypothetical protein